MERGSWEVGLHEGAADVGDGDDAFFFALEGLGKEGEGFADLGFFLGGDVVFFGELGGPGSGGFGGGGCCECALRWRAAARGLEWLVRLGWVRGKGGLPFCCRFI